MGKKKFLESLKSLEAMLVILGDTFHFTHIYIYKSGKTLLHLYRGSFNIFGYEEGETDKIVYSAH